MKRKEVVSYSKWQIIVLWLVGIGMAFAILYANPFFQNGSPKNGDPLLPLTLVSGFMTGYFLFFSYPTTDRLLAVLRYAVTGFCAGALGIGIWNGQDPIRWLGLVGLIVFVFVVLLKRSGTKEIIEGKPIRQRP